ncbi:MAG: hypothetical protein ACTHL8_09045 [Burkholderiaceae bacterium]
MRTRPRPCPRTQARARPVDQDAGAGARPERLAGAGAGRRSAKLAAAATAALACLATPLACAQVSGSLGLAGADRYRGTGTPNAGAVLRASAMIDLPAPFAQGGYAGVSGLWRTRDGGLANAEAIAGWSGRWNAFSRGAALDPAWGWDLGVHRMHYGASGRYDFTEAMAGLLAPGASARVWWSPHYFGGGWSSVYAEANGRLDLDGCWHVLGHLGVLRYGNTHGRHVPGRTDALTGVDCTLGDWDVRLTRDGLLAGRPLDDVDARRRAPAWVLAASVVF